MIQTLLITGAAGYIGSFVNKLLLEQGFKTIILDNLSKGKKEYVVGGELIVGDFGDPKLLKEIFKRKIDGVFHFAAFTDVGESVEKPLKYYQNNVVNTLHLLEAMQTAGVKKLIFSSSAAVYGHPEEEPIRETARQKPINPYGETKRVVEEMIHWTNLDAISLRYFNVAGGDPSGQLLYKNPKPTNVIPILLNGLAENKVFTLFGDDYPTPDGTCIRDYIHLYDLAQGHLLAWKQLEKGKKRSLQPRQRERILRARSYRRCRKSHWHESEPQKRPSPPWRSSHPAGRCYACQTRSRLDHPLSHTRTNDPRRLARLQQITILPLRQP